jgi:hypothetical protein
MRGIGKETAAVLSTITTRIMIETAIPTIMTNMAIMVTAGTTDSHIGSESLRGFGGPRSKLVLGPSVPFYGCDSPLRAPLK